MSQTQQGLWSRAVKFAKTNFTKPVMKKAASALLTKVGVKASGFYLWITTVGIKELWKVVLPILVKYSYLWDRNKINKANEKELKANETNGATTDEKVKDELNFLNGNKPNSK